MPKLLIIKNIILQLIIITCLTLTLQVKLSAQISGPTSVCVGETEVYEILGANTGSIYSWTITPSGSGQLANVQNYNLAYIQWNATGNYQISVTDGTSTHSFNVFVSQSNTPYISYDNEVGCQKLYIEDNEQTSVIEETEYINVCENSEVLYTVHGTLFGVPPVMNLSNFDWTVSGGQIIEVDGNTIAPTNSVNGSGIYSGTYSTVLVRWGGVGTAYLEVTELTPTNCKAKTGSLSFKIIESPLAEFLIDDVTTLPQPCYNVCLNQKVNFIDKSLANPGSDIITWEWDFGDGSAISHLQNPSHKYTTSGTYNVNLKVTNKCGCSDIFEYEICVEELPAIQIECPSVVCEGERTKYVMNDPHCSSYVWSVTGGTIVQQNDPEIIIQWNNVGSDGFGYLGLDASYCPDVCNNITKIQVPVILANGTITGPTNTCFNTEYYFELPAWPATNFHWTITSNTNGASFSSYDENSHKVSVVTGGVYGSFTLECVYQNTISKNYNCGGSASITVNVKEKAIIQAPVLSCINTSISASVSNYTSLTGSTSWWVEDNQGNQLWIGSSITQNISIPASVFNQSGDYFIFASNTASFCDPDFVKVKVRDLPPAPTSIQGEDIVCPHYPYPYSVDIEDNTIVHWTASNGTIQGVAYGNTINSAWLPTNPKTITAYREWEDLPGCFSANYSKPITNIVVSGTITGNTTVEEDALETYTLNLSNGVVPENIHWTISPSEFAGFATGQGTNTVDINLLNHPYNSLNALIQCNVSKCGVTTVISLPITILSSTQINSLSGPTTVCSGDQSSWTVNTTGAAPTAIEWDFGDGTIINQSAAGQPILSTSHSYSNLSNSNIVFTITVTSYSGSNNAPSSVYTQNITVYPQPNIGLSPVNTETYCQTMGTYPVSISNNSLGSFSYQWFFKAVNSTYSLPILNSTGISYTISSTLLNTNPGSTTSDGDYWCEVINTGTGCSSISNKKTVIENCPTPPPGGCTPMSPAGISNFSLSNSCGEIQTSCNTSGTIGTNINSFNWYLTGPGSYTSSGTATQNQSMVYTVDKAGIYNFEINVQYKDANNPSINCSVSEDDYITVPLIADFLKAIICNSSGTSYDLQFTDHSSVYPANTTLSYQWRVNNILVSTTSNFMLSALAPNSVQNVEFTVSDGINTCTKSIQIIIPALPNADFSATTTYPGSPSNPYKSCEGREIELTNLSSPVADIKFYEWDFNDISTSNQKDPVKVYSYSGYVQGNNGFADIYLKVTNNYGCFDELTKYVNVYENSLTYDLNPTSYIPHINDYCYGNSLSNSISINNLTEGTQPWAYQWYKETNILPNQLGSTLTGTPALPGTGAYWVMVTDANNCYKAINPTPAMISAKFPPTAIIQGKSNICEGEEFTLTALTGMPTTAGLTYEWSFSDGVNTVISGQTSKKYTFSHGAGTYTYTLKVSGLSTCPDVYSAPFVLTVHPQPSSPTVSMSLIDCDEYKIELSGSSILSPTPAFNWSNGSSTQSTFVYNGGAYRLWITDQYGCRNHTDIEIPQSPDVYFWRFPTGCYSFCPDDLPKRVDGPWSVVFESWEWRKDNAVITNNGAYSGSGANTPCDPLIIDRYPNGEDDGDYNWSLDNGLCKKLTGYMNISIIECCEDIDMQLVDIRCIQTLPNGNNYFSYEIDVSTIACQNAIYSLSGLDQNGLPVSNITSAPATLNPGTNTITGNFVTDPNAHTIILYITVFCEEVCTGELEIDLPDCPGNKGSAKLANYTMAEKDDNTYLQLIPNPANDKLTIHYKSKQSKEENPKLQLRLLDAFGKLLSTLRVNETEGKLDINLDNYSQGLYFIELIENEKQISIEKLIILQ